MGCVPKGALFPIFRAIFDQSPMGPREQGAIWALEKHVQHEHTEQESVPPLYWYWIKLLFMWIPLDYTESAHNIQGYKLSHHRSSTVKGNPGHSLPMREGETVCVLNWLSWNHVKRKLFVSAVTWLGRGQGQRGKTVSSHNTTLYCVLCHCNQLQSCINPSTATGSSIGIHFLLCGWLCDNGYSQITRTDTAIQGPCLYHTAMVYLDTKLCFCSEMWYSAGRERESECLGERELKGNIGLCMSITPYVITFSPLFSSTYSGLLPSAVKCRPIEWAHIILYLIL